MAVNATISQTPTIHHILIPATPDLKLCALLAVADTVMLADDRCDSVAAAALRVVPTVDGCELILDTSEVQLDPPTRGFTTSQTSNSPCSGVECWVDWLT